MSFLARLKGKEDITDDYNHPGWNPRVGLPVMGFTALAILGIISQCQKSSAKGNNPPKQSQ